MRAALLFFAFIHAVALATMLLLLRPGMDVAAFSLAERASYVASHGSAWRWGWLPWQLSALSDLGVSIAFWRWAARRADVGARRFAAWALALFVISAVPEQWAELQLVTSFIDAARGDLDAWQRSWALYAAMTGVWANLGYTIMTYCWMQCARRLLGRPVLAPWLEWALVGAFVLAGALTGVATWVDDEHTVGAWFTAAGAVNGLAFPALIAWSLLLVKQLSAARSTPDGPAKEEAA